MNLVANLISQERQVQSNKFLDFLALDKKLVFFGAGAFVESVLINHKNPYAFDYSTLHVDYLCDNDKRKVGCTLFDIPIISFEELLIIKNHVKVAITTIPHYYEVMRQLKQHDFPHILECEIDITRNLQYFPIQYTLFSCSEWMKDLYNSVFRDKDELISLYETLEDDLSRQTLLGVIRSRLDFNLVHIRRIARSAPGYFDEDFFEFDEDEVLVDIGAFIGDSIIDFNIHTEGKWRYIYAFEAEDRLYRRLSENICTFPNPKRIKLENAAVCNHNGEIYLSIDNEHDIIARSNISDKGTQKVLGIRLDDYGFDDLLGSKVTLIKIDIEGAEIKALTGAIEVIRTHCPNLAISIYHKSDDIWRIPKLIKSINPMYKLYMRHRGQYFTETILYAIIPKT